MKRVLWAQEMAHWVGGQQHNRKLDPHIYIKPAGYCSSLTPAQGYLRDQLKYSA